MHVREKTSTMEQIHQWAMVRWPTTPYAARPPSCLIRARDFHVLTWGYSALLLPTVLNILEREREMRAWANINISHSKKYRHLFISIPSQ